jgi:5-methylcytosine-specific restriction endonuclease McrA
MNPPRVTVATDVHHIQKLTLRPDLKYDETNLMALDKSCHQVRTARGE